MRDLEIPFLSNATTKHSLDPAEVLNLPRSELQVDPFVNLRSVPLADLDFVPARYLNSFFSTGEVSKGAVEIKV